MSLEPKPRSMAAVTITVNSKGKLLPCGRYKIWLNAGTSEYLPVLPSGSDNLWSADDQQERHALSLNERQKEGR